MKTSGLRPEPRKPLKRLDPNFDENPRISRGFLNFVAVYRQSKFKVFVQTFFKKFVGVGKAHGFDFKK